MYTYVKGSVDCVHICDGVCCEGKKAKKGFIRKERNITDRSFFRENGKLAPIKLRPIKEIKNTILWILQKLVSAAEKHL